MFLTDKEVAELTGIKRGRAGRTKGDMQCEHLARVGVPFHPDTHGRPKVVAEALLVTGRQAASKARAPQLRLPGPDLSKVK